MTRDDHPDRRYLLGLAAAALGEALLCASAAAQTRSRGEAPLRTARPAPATPAARRTGRFFTPAEFQLLDELAEAIIPADEVSGGAKAAKVALTLERQLGETLDPLLNPGFKEDLAEIDRICREMHGRGFVAASPSQRNSLLRRISRNEGNSRVDVEHSFGVLKWLVTYAYYKSQIGIHDDLKYQGNVLIDEFIGADPSKA
jgi:hypothetical protein